MFCPFMLLKTKEKPFASNDYLYERKYDGIRLQYNHLEELSLYTRNKNNVNHLFPELLLYPMPRGIVLDGELIGTEDTEHEDIEIVKQRLFMKNKDKIYNLASQGRLQYIVFDILFFQGKDVRDLPLTDRKSLLRDITIKHPLIKIIEEIDLDGEAFFQSIVNQGLEGMVCKKIDSRYIGERSDKWLKIINWIETKAYIKGIRKKDHGLICYNSMGDMMGYVLPGVTPVALEALLLMHHKDAGNTEDEVAKYFNASIPCLLRGRGFLRNGKLRSAAFKSFIFD